MSLDLGALSDGELASLTAAGRQAAFVEIMRRYRDPIYRLIRGCTGDPEESLDLTQDCFAAAYRAIGRFDDQRSMRAWLATIALNRSRDWLRRRRIRRLLTFSGSSQDDLLAGIADESPAVDEAAFDRRQLRHVEQAISRLPSRQRETLVLRAIEGLTQAETAQVLGISQKAVETRLHRARKRLSTLLGDGQQFLSGRRI